jgi:hypothetical protein
MFCLFRKNQLFEIQYNVYVYVVGNDSNRANAENCPFCSLIKCICDQLGFDGKDKVIYEGIQRVKEGDKIIPEIDSLLIKKTINDPMTGKNNIPANPCNRPYPSFCYFLGYSPYFRLPMTLFPAVCTTGSKCRS